MGGRVFSLRGFSYLRSDPRILAYGVLLALGSSFGQTFFVSLFSGDIRATFGLSHGDFGIIYSVGTLSSAAVLSWTGSWFDRLDLRVWTALLVVLFAGGCLLMAGARNTAMLVVAVFLLRQLGQGLMGQTATTSQARYYAVARGRAVATAGLGFPLGEAVLPLVGVTVVAFAGWRGGWVVFALALLTVWLPLSLWLLRGHDLRQTRYIARETAAENAAAHCGRTQWRRRDVLRDYRFFLLLPPMLAPAFVNTGIFFHQVHLSAVKGWPLELWAAAYTAYAAATVPSSFLTGAIIDRYGETWALPLFLVPLGTACWVLSAFDNPLTPWVFMGISGLTSGATATIFGAFWAGVYGTRHLGAIRSMTTALMVFSSALSPALFGALLDRAVTINQLIAACAVYCAVGVGLCLVCARLYRRGG